MIKMKSAIGAFVDTLSDIVSDIVPRKTLEESIEEKCTKKVSYFRVQSFPKVYVYGKRPGEPLVKIERNAEGEKWPCLEPEHDERVIREHFAKCSQVNIPGGGLCDMCRKLDNPRRRAFLVRLYSDGRPIDRAGFNVGEAEDKSDLHLSATSDYLRDLADLGLIRRERNGRLVIYTPELCGAMPRVAEIGAMMKGRWCVNPKDESFVPAFHVMMGPFRAKVVRHLAAGGSGLVEALADQFHKRSSDLMRELEWAVKGGLLDLNSEDECGEYRYITPADPIARRIVELS